MPKASEILGQDANIPSGADLKVKVIKPLEPTDASVACFKKIMGFNYVQPLHQPSSFIALDSCVSSKDSQLFEDRKKFIELLNNSVDELILVTQLMNPFFSRASLTEHPMQTMQLLQNEVYKPNWDKFCNNKILNEIPIMERTDFKQKLQEVYQKNFQKFANEALPKELQFDKGRARDVFFSKYFFGRRHKSCSGQ